VGDEWDLSEHPDLASARASVLRDIALNYEDVKDKAVGERMLKAMDLLNEGIERIIRPKAKGKPAALLPIKGGKDDDP
jgi:hypothetical protein